VYEIVFCKIISSCSFLILSGSTVFDSFADLRFSSRMLTSVIVYTPHDLIFRMEN
jgi:hypothetical protein